MAIILLPGHSSFDAMSNGDTNNRLHGQGVRTCSEMRSLTNCCSGTGAPPTLNTC